MSEENIKTFSFSFRVIDVDKYEIIIYVEMIA